MQQNEELSDWADDTGVEVAQHQRHDSKVSCAPQTPLDSRTPPSDCPREACGQVEHQLVVSSGRDNGASVVLGDGTGPAALLALHPGHTAAAGASRPG